MVFPETFVASRIFVVMVAILELLFYSQVPNMRWYTVLEYHILFIFDSFATRALQADRFSRLTVHHHLVDLVITTYQPRRHATPERDFAMDFKTTHVAPSTLLVPIYRDAI